MDLISNEYGFPLYSVRMNYSRLQVEVRTVLVSPGLQYTDSRSNIHSVKGMECDVIVNTPLYTSS